MKKILLAISTVLIFAGAQAQATEQPAAKQAVTCKKPPEPPKDKSGKPLPPPNNDNSQHEPPKDKNGKPLPPPDGCEPPQDKDGKPLPPPKDE